MRVLLKNGTVIDYASKTNEKLDILIENDKIKKVAKDLNESADKILDCTNYIIMPGMIDLEESIKKQ